MSSELPDGVILRPPDRVRCQVAVVGSGPGGAVAASLLANAGRDVLLIEEGPYISQEACRLYSREEMEQKYRNGGVNLALGRPKVTYIEARCVGGGSEVNAGLYYRTPPEILQRWQSDFQVADLSPEQLAPHFESIEKSLNVTNAPEESQTAGSRLRIGAEALGLSSLDSQSSLRMGPKGTDGTLQGHRVSMTRTFLPQAFDRGAHLLAQTRVVSFRRDGGRWLVRCHYSPSGEMARELIIEADVLFLSCGAVQTPALLRRSGIKRNIGNSLAMHATAKVTARFDQDVNHPGMGVPTHAVDEFAPRYFFTCASSAPSHLALEMIQYPDHFHGLRDNWSRMAVYSARIAGGKGSVRALPGFADPLVRFRLSDSDLRDLSEATRQLCSLLFAAGAEELYPSLIIGEPLRSPRELDRIPMPLKRSLTNLMTIHISSSCPMGENLDRCAVDSFGKVHGTDALYVADASLLCTAPTVNPQGSIMAVVRRNLHHYLATR